MKLFKCGLCKSEERIGRTRKGLRKHLSDEHRIIDRKTNTGYVKGVGYGKQKWWIVEDFK